MTSDLIRLDESIISTFNETFKRAVDSIETQALKLAKDSEMLEESLDFLVQFLPTKD